MTVTSFVVMFEADDDTAQKYRFLVDMQDVASCRLGPLKPLEQSTHATFDDFHIPTAEELAAARAAHEVAKLTDSIITNASAPTSTPTTTNSSSTSVAPSESSTTATASTTGTTTATTISSPTKSAQRSPDALLPPMPMSVDTKLSQKNQRPFSLLGKLLSPRSSDSEDAPHYQDKTDQPDQNDKEHLLFTISFAADFTNRFLFSSDTGEAKHSDVFQIENNFGGDSET